MNVLFYKVIYGRRFTVNLIKSYFDGYVTIDKGWVFIDNGLRNKRNLNVCVKNNGKLKIGKRCFFNNNVSINCHYLIDIGDECIFGENIVIYDHDHKFDVNGGLFRNQGFSAQAVYIGNNVWIGSSTVILAGSIIEDNCVIAASSVVKGHVAKNTIYLQKRNNTNLTLK